MLLVASYVFYSWAAPEFSLLLALSTVLNYWFGHRIADALGGEADQKRARSWMLTSLGFNLGMLAFFKYLGFFADNVSSLLGLVGMEMTWSTEFIVLPIGISFYTFQTLSYTIDIYRGRFQPVHDFFDFGLFVVFFPQLVMGPIERATNLLPQIQKPRSPDADKFVSGTWLVFLGIYKKVFVADQISRYVDPLFALLGRTTRAAMSPLGRTALLVADLRRLLGLLGRGPRLRTNDGVRADAELPRALLCAEHPGLLVTLAHQPLDLDQGLPVLPAGAQPQVEQDSRCRRALRGHDGDHGILARGELDVRVLGLLPWRVVGALREAQAVPVPAHDVPIVAGQGGVDDRVHSCSPSRWSR